MIEYDKTLSNMGKRIVEKRKQLGLSQEELAEKAGITVQMLSTAERGAKGMRSKISSIFSWTHAEIKFNITQQQSGATKVAPLFLHSI